MLQPSSHVSRGALQSLHHGLGELHSHPRLWPCAGGGQGQGSCHRDPHPLRAEPPAVTLGPEWAAQMKMGTGARKRGKTMQVVTAQQQGH